MPKTIKYTTKGEGYAKYCNKVCPHTGAGIGSNYCVNKCENLLSWDKAEKIVVCGFGDEVDKRDALINRISSKMHDLWCEKQRADGIHHPMECTYTKKPVAERRTSVNFCAMCNLSLVPYNQLQDDQKDRYRENVLSVLGFMDEEI